MRTEIKQWGNSAVVRIPAPFLHGLSLSVGSAIELTVEDGRMVIAPAKPVFQLDALLAGITPENRHESVEWGTPVGREVAA